MRAAPLPPTGARAPQTPFRRVVDDFFANPVATFGFGLLCLIVFFAIFAPLIVMTLLLGVYPALVTDIIGPSVAQLVTDYHAALPEVADAATH